MRRWAALLAILLAAPALRAHDGPPYPLFMDEPIGAYKVSVWADPDVGIGTFFIHVEAAGGEAATGVKVTVSVVPVTGRLAEASYPAQPQTLNRRVQYFAEVPFDAQEYWRVRVGVAGAGGSGEVATVVEATPDGLGRWDLLVYLFPFALVAALWVYGIFRHRRRWREEQSPRGNAAGGDPGPP